MGKRVRRVVAVAVAGITAAMLGNAGLARAEQNLRVGYVDVKKVFEEYKATKDSRVTLEKEKKEKEGKVVAWRTKIEKMVKDMESQQSVMKPEKKKEKQDEIMREQEQLQQFVDASLGELLKKEKVLTENIVGDIRAVVKDISIAENFDYVFVNDALFYGGENITEKVITALNKKK